MVDSSISQLVGTTVANYRLEKVVEMHVWGPIFQARGPQDRQYMLRFIGEPSAREPVGLSQAERIIFLGRFQQEANRIATLRHSNILPLVDYGNFHGTPYLVYPVISLPSLRALLSDSSVNANRHTNLQMVGRSLEQIAATLNYAHENVVLHQNLSTQCIYVQGNRQLLVGEFGILRIVQLSRPDLQTHLGSSESSAPEQLLGKTPDPSADIYALGAVLYRLLTGHAPFEGRTRADVARQHLYAAVPPLRTWRNDLPQELEEVLIKALAKDPGERYTFPEELVQAYYRALGWSRAGGNDRRKAVTPPTTSSILPAVNLKGKSPSLYTPSPTRAGRTPKRSRRYFITALAGAGGLAAVAALVGTHTVKIPGLGTTSANATATHPINSTRQNMPTAQSTGTQNAGTQIARAVDVPVNSAKIFPIANQKNPGLLVHLPDNSFVAFDSTCTHAGCAVSYNNKTQHLECPCHGAIFDPAKDAEVLAGPAPSPLTPITIAVNADGTIVTKNSNNA